MIELIEEREINKSQQTVIIPVGVPGCGKSTFIKEIASKQDTIVIETDAIREELTGSASDQSQNKKVFEVAYNRLNSGLANDETKEKTFVFDATNISKWSRKGIIDIAKKYNARVVAIVMTTPLETCIKRNNARERVVPEDVIRRMYSNLEKPSKAEGFDEIIYH